ncbi:putative disease resistance protein At3g14460 [Cajanus cajan]|uniref:Disease resistance RPP13-like protein 1 n=1 Tax=Cajanus cajan TaxID=3821 RepID=A0A151SHY2_CAJCA|nr:putative disease resistance protein At3g14460 [Cajanus cajan]KYP54446.1 Putative disease resistance RPP13-like protein 1 [Cajanus cajan]
MAEGVVVGAFLSSFLEVVFDRLSSPQFVNLIQGKKLDQHLLERLKSALYAVQSVVNDAEHKQINDPAVKNWLHDLKDAVYVADDLLDQVSTAAATQNEVSNFLSIFLNLRDRKVANKIQDITSKLEYIVKYKDVLGLQEVGREHFSWRAPSTSLLEGYNVYGRDQDRETMVKLLLDDGSDDNISVMPIVGMGGVGKTTLAQLMYNDENLMNKFELKGWVCVSEEFDVFKVTKTLIEAVTFRACNMKDLNSLQLDLKKILTGKKFFVVLDDVWNDDYNGWCSLIKPFLYGLRGSKILVTTRSEKVASIVQTCPPYYLNHLSDEHCWSLFADHACFPKSNGNSTLEKIGREIVTKCKGLPLAAQTLGGQLRTKRYIKDWNTILDKELWEFPVIIPTLRRSYYHLPSHLKRCFVYCSLYPKNYKFVKDELILLWMAEDLLEQPKRGKTIEEVGSEYFDDLASRLFLKQFKTDDDQTFVMHDLINDLAISLAGDFYFRSEELGREDKINFHTHHLSYGSLSHPISKNFDAIVELKTLRTFLQIKFSPPSFSFESTALIILSKFKYLRVLSFSCCRELEELPDLVGELIHLRYLDLSKTSIQTLPESLSNLFNLQTLKLLECIKLTMLPSGMQNLENLRHLDIRGTSLEVMPQGMSKLKHLQVLSYFVVGKQEENGIKELGELSNLHGSLWIRKLENITDGGEAGEARIMYKTHIKDLSLEWSSGVDLVTTSTITEREILEELQPHKGLKVLSINTYRGTLFPHWVGHSSYHNMTRVILFSCSNCCMLPSLGQLPLLKFLEIQDFNGVETIGAEFYKNDNDHHSSLEIPFPCLECLSFGRMPCWKAWHSIEPDNVFPQLKQLTIFDCPMLTGDLPNHLPALETLEIHKCVNLISSLPMAPAICELMIDESHRVVLQSQELPISLQSLSVGGCELVESVFKAIAIHQPTSLQFLSISDCSSDISLSLNCLPKCLKQCQILNCEKLEFLKHEQQHNSLESLELDKSCDSLTWLSLEAFPSLKILELKGCRNLESISMPRWRDSALDELFIRDCPNFTSFPEQGLTASNMNYFTVMGCDKLKSLPRDMKTLLPKLKRMEISDCPEIDSFPQGGLPPKMEALVILNCEKLLRGLSSMGTSQALGLSFLSIGGVFCESVKSFQRRVWCLSFPL